MTRLAARIDSARLSDLFALGLHAYTANVLLALIDLGEGDSAAIAKRSGVPRTSIYGAARTLQMLGVVERLPETAGQSTTWKCHGWGAVLDALDAAAYQRLQAHYDRSKQVRRAVLG